MFLRTSDTSALHEGRGLLLKKDMTRLQVPFLILTTRVRHSAGEENIEFTFPPTEMCNSIAERKTTIKQNESYLKNLNIKLQIAKLF